MPASPLQSPRTLTVVAQDPEVLDGDGVLMAEVPVLRERLEPGPKACRVHVIDFDASTDTLYAPADIGSSGDLYRGVRDRERLLRDPRFHAQNVYAIVMSTLSRFEFALGRRVGWQFGVLKVAPHAFADANAFYSRRDEGLLFGYFPSRRTKETVFTCLSHDVVAHETTHALLDGLRPRYVDGTSIDQGGFHEGFADVVALLCVFRLRPVLAALLPKAKGGRIPAKELSASRLRRTALFTLADQMGKELRTHRGNALRESADLPPSRKYLETPEFSEPHRRGELFVAAIMNAFLDVWLSRLGLGEARQRRGELDRERVIDEGTSAADHLLTMVIRAIDYAPPVDLQFGDFVSALLTADREMHPDDQKFGYRATLRRVFESYGVEAASDADGEGVWQHPPREVSYDGVHFDAMRHDPAEVFRFLWENREALEIDPGAYTFVQSVRPCFRVSTDGFVLNETVAEYVQIADLVAADLPSVGLRAPKGMSRGQKIRLWGGGTLIFDQYGQLRFHIGSGVRSKRQQRRLDYRWRTGDFHDRTASARRFLRMHLRRAVHTDRNEKESW